MKSIDELMQVETSLCQDGEMPPLDGEPAGLFYNWVFDWKIVERQELRCLKRVFEFPDFAHALVFTDMD